MHTMTAVLPKYVDNDLRNSKQLWIKAPRYENNEKLKIPVGKNLNTFSQTVLGYIFLEVLLTKTLL
jgi:hypothetical protein